MSIHHVTYIQGIEEDEISFARELFPKTRQHGLAIGIRLKDDLAFEENEEEVKMSINKRHEEDQKYEEKEEREYEEDEETSARESELSSASDSVSLEVFSQLKGLGNLWYLKVSPGTKHWQEWEAILSTFKLALPMSASSFS